MNYQSINLAILGSFGAHSRPRRYPHHQLLPLPHSKSATDIVLRQSPPVELPLLQKPEKGQLKKLVHLNRAFLSFPKLKVSIEPKDTRKHKKEQVDKDVPASGQSSKLKQTITPLESKPFQIKLKPALTIPQQTFCQDQLKRNQNLESKETKGRVSQVKDAKKIKAKTANKKVTKEQIEAIEVSKLSKEQQFQKEKQKSVNLQDKSQTKKGREDGAKKAKDRVIKRIKKRDKQLEQLLYKRKNERAQKYQSGGYDGTAFKGLPADRDQRYQHMRVLHEGEFATVFEARDVRTSKLLVLKCYQKFKLSDPRHKQMVSREISLLKKLKHKNMVQLYDSFSTKRGTTLVLEHMPYNLAELLQRRGQFSPEELKLILRQIADCLSYCHSHDVIHRDLKLQNVLIDDQLQVRLSDFGLSTYEGQTQDLYIGTFLYMAPEILLRDRHWGKPTDIWALGVLWHYLERGEFPFKGDTDSELIDSIHESTVPTHLQPLLQIEPGKRLTASEVAGFVSAM